MNGLALIGLGISIPSDTKVNNRLYYAMIVKREEQLPSTGSITNAPIVVHTIQDFYDQNPQGVRTADSMLPQCR